MWSSRIGRRLVTLKNFARLPPDRGHGHIAVRFARRIAARTPTSLGIPRVTITSAEFECRRSLFGWLNNVFNTVDENRIGEIGPDLAAAEWIMRCGGGVRWVGHDEVTRDYNLLPHQGSGAKIELIDATEACVMSHGFPYLRELKEVKVVKLIRCPYLDDEAFPYLKNLEKLERLEIMSCGNVTDHGLDSLKELKQLKDLVLFDLPEVDRKAALKALRAALPDTRIEFRTASRTAVHSRR